MEILETIENFLKKQRMSESAFGRQALNDRRLVTQIRRGRRPNPLTVARIEGFIRGAESQL